MCEIIIKDLFCICMLISDYILRFFWGGRGVGKGCEQHIVYNTPVFAVFELWLSGLARC